MPCDTGCNFQGAIDENLTNFTCGQLIEYCGVYKKWISTESCINTTVNVGLLVGGLAGMISYVLMILVFRLPDFKGASYIYHKSIVCMELVHMFVMAQAGLERFLPTDKTSYSYVFYIKVIRELWLVGDAMKLSTSMVTTFLSLERFVAILLPKAFTRFNQPKIAWTFVVISVCFSLLSFSPAFTESLEQRIVNNVTIWTDVVKQGQGSFVGGDAIITYIIYGAKGITSVIMVVCCIGVASGLIVKSKKTSTMSSTARSKWKENRRLSCLQIVIALLQIIDHVMWVMSGVIMDQPPSELLLGVEAITKLTFDQSIEVIKFKAFWRWIFASQEVTGILDHAARLPLYLIGMKRFREGFIGLFSRNGHVKQSSGASRHQNPNAVAPVEGHQLKMMKSGMM